MARILPLTFGRIYGIIFLQTNNGVIILGENTVFIDADVEIEEGTIIYPNNIIK